MTLTDEEVRSVINHWKQTEKNTQSSIISFHPIEEKWLSDIQQELGYSTLSDKTRNQIARIVAILFKEEYRFSEK